MNTSKPTRSPSPRRTTTLLAGLTLVASTALIAPTGAAGAAAPADTSRSTASSASTGTTAGGTDARAPKAGKKAKKKQRINKMRKSSKALMKAVKPKASLKHLRKLQRISDRHGSRASGTPGYAASRDYVVRRLKRAGYSPVVQEFEFPFFDVTGTTTFALTAPEARTLSEDEDYALMTYSGSGDVTAPVQPVDLALADPPTSTSGCEAADFAGFPAGAIALMQRGTCPFGDKVANAQAAGAAAAIVMNQGDEPGERTDLYFGTLGAPGATIPALSTSFTLGAELAETAGLEARVAAQTESEIRTTWNVLAETRGAKKNVVMAGAHLDSVTEGAGINDNGSGSAALLTVAEKFAKTKHQPRHKKNKMNRVRFAWWGAEELNLLGAEHYVGDLATNRPAQLKRIALYLNFDMVASPNYSLMVYDGDNSAFPPGDDAAAAPKGSGAIERLFHRVFESKGIISAETEFSGRSDYGPFIDQNIPSGGLFTGAEGIKTPLEARLYGGKAGVAYDPCYHQACDRMSNVSKKALKLNGKAIAHAVWTYAKSTKSVNGVTVRKSNKRLVQQRAVDGRVDALTPRPHDTGSGPGSPLR